METYADDKEARGSCLRERIKGLRDDIKTLENNFCACDYVPTGLVHDFVWVDSPAITKEDALQPQKYSSAQLSKVTELTSEASGFKLKAFSRNLRFSPGELYTYDCLIEGCTSSVSFRVKFTEIVKGPQDKCGEISAMKADVIMLKGDPESLSDWISACCETGDLPMYIHGLVEFTELAANRRSILRSIYKRGKSENLGTNHFSIIGEGDGVMVIGIGPNNVNMFSINWKIGYFPATKSMKSTFMVELHGQDLRYESAEIFAALERPFLTEEDLPLLWEAVADVLFSCV